MMIDVSKLSYEDACRIAGVPKERGYVTLREVISVINEKLGLDLDCQEQVGWAPMRSEKCAKYKEEGKDVCRHTRVCFELYI